jgi:hypothetical protein
MPIPRLRGDDVCRVSLILPFDTSINSVKLNSGQADFCHVSLAPFDKLRVTQLELRVTTTVSW